MEGGETFDNRWRSDVHETFGRVPSTSEGSHEAEKSLQTAAEELP